MYPTAKETNHTEAEKSSSNIKDVEKTGVATASTIGIAKIYVMLRFCFFSTFMNAWFVSHCIFSIIFSNTDR
jgi:hypothetical protein